ncbi:MAG: Na(+)-translocating NADH-quinone reductase subunit A [Candidatus Marinimicrobia bacterium]|jgi:Na+-transporting NADH:ubiquinone oxidoreductase subunit A|nr:Na(+)-translocating NADH-quinone reductase subunit A [Candidatus Neomarinimicrobiota bacterium]MBT4361012.1 Na(+)-translocating NADH-quinone reductase subunit A [Candidatus Neomarinimicrobiota bacterium]MBT4945206.1 Na(+)-translocating NADH-quinone reductase subunit A [Candidatus Neomarinimicrobiota bacterium]MBT5270612.1 Na(+)-translocating NADH-quinone reductase subunit A [Candidatus Neomarinimicrobiota bacterium]MBT6011783.1 Na(+)-translocating NADH-quinone reductase subunit A [Candidatus
MGMFKLKKGYDIPLQGSAERRVEKAPKTTAVAVQPIDFRGLRPAMKVEAGDKVSRGSILFVDKQKPAILFRSPAAGTVRDVVRGERRVIQRVIIDVAGDAAEKFESYTSDQVNALSISQAKEVLLNSGLWPVIRQRPFSRIADLDGSPKAIFISAVDSAPLQAESDLLLDGLDKEFQLGINLLSILTPGKIHLSASAKTKAFFSTISGVELHEFSGPHPAGNVGVQIHHIDRILSGEKVWYISPRHVSQIGRLLATGEYPGAKTYALTGSELEKGHYVRGTEGAQVSDLVSQDLKGSTQRVISGNVLTGAKSSPLGFVGFYDDMITVVPELEGRRFFGWLRLGLNANSFWPMFLSKLTPKKKLAPTTDMNGEERAFVSTGEYEKVVPMDVLPVHLCKAILVDDIELMEQLGIYEVAAEDLALCSYICPSKIEFGDIIQKGIETMEKEG